MDPNYEFDAPMYVDFKNALPDDGVDSWFGEYFSLFASAASFHF